jgi:hypothetical protein
MRRPANPVPMRLIKQPFEMPIDAIEYTRNIMLMKHPKICIKVIFIDESIIFFNIKRAGFLYPLKAVIFYIHSRLNNKEIKRITFTRKPAGKSTQVNL